MNTEKQPVLCTTLYRKPMQPCNYGGILYQLRNGIFSYGFHQKIRFKRSFKKRPKSDYRQKSNFQPYSDALTRWVPYDGYIRHQNDHLSGRMTNISVMGEWQVAGVGEIRPLEKVLGAALEGRFSFKARNYLFSFQRYDLFEEFFVSHAFERFDAKRSSSGAFGFDDVLEVFLKTPLRHRAFFCELRLRPRVIFENFLSFSQRAGVPWQLWRSPGWAKHFGDGTSKTRMKTWSTSSLGEIERRWTIDRRRDWYESFAVIHRPNRKKTKQKHNEASVWSCKVSTLHHLQTREFWAACFRDPMSQPFCTSLLSCTRMCSCRTVRLQREESEEKQSSVTFPVLITEA